MKNFYAGRVPEDSFRPIRNLINQTLSLRVAWGVFLLLSMLSLRTQAQTAPSSITISGACFGGTYVLDKVSDNYEATNRPAYLGSGTVTLNGTAYNDVQIAAFYEPSGPAWVIAFDGGAYLSNPSTANIPPTSGWVVEDNSQAFGNCTGPSPFQVTTGTVRITPASLAAVCSGSPVSLTAVPTNFTSPTYAWSSTPSGFSGSGAVFTQNAPTVNATTNYTIRVVATGGVASATATIGVTVNPSPTLVAGATVNPTTCGGTSGSIAFTTSNLPNGTYSVSFTGTGSPKTVTVTSNAFNLTGLGAGTYSNFSVTSNGCTGTVATSKTLTDPVAPTLTLGAGTNPTSCGGSNGSIAFTTSLANGTYSLTYTGTGSPQTITVTSGAFSLTGLSAGTYSNFSVTANGCTGTVATSRTLSDPAQPLASVGAAQSICVGTAATLSATATNGTGVWSVQSGPSTSASQFNNTASTSAVFTPAGGAGSYTLRWTVSNGSCTPATADVVITVNALPTLTAGAPTNPSCTASNGSIAFTTGNVPNGTYSVSFTGTGSPKTVTVTSNAFSLTGLASGTYSNFSITANGCTGSVSSSVTLNEPAPITVSLSSSGTITCSNTAVTLTANSAEPNLVYVFTGPSGAVASTGATASVSQAGTYTVVASAPTGCTASATTTVISDALSPQSVSISLSGPLSCNESTVTVTGGTSTPNSTFAFTGPGIVSVSGNVATVNRAGLYTVIVTSPNGCTASNSTTLTGSADRPENLSLTASGQISCSQTTVTLTAASSTTGVTYSFSGPGIVSTTANTALVSLAGTYTVVATATSGCTSLATTTVIGDTQSPQNVSLTASGPITCTNPTVTLTAGSTTGGVTYSFSGPGIVSTTAGTATVSQAGTYTVRVTATNGCTATTSTTVIGNTEAPQNVGLVASGSISCANPAATLTASSSSANVTYVFKGASGVVASTGATASVTQAGTYTVIATGPNGCTASATVTVAGDSELPQNVTLSASGPLSCTVSSILLTAGSSTSGVTYTFSNGAAQIGNGNTATVTSAGTYSVVVTRPNGCSTSASTTVILTNDVPPAPDLSSRTVSQNTGDVTLTATNCTGTINWTGPNNTSGTGSIVVPTATVGSFAYAAVCVRGTCTSAPANLTVTVTSAASQALQLVTPLYNCLTGSLTFQTTGGTGGLIEFRAIGVTDWSSNPTHVVEAELRADANSSGVLMLMARQNGQVVTLNFDFRAFCAGSNGNQPPQVVMPISTQGATQGSPFSFAIPSGTFADPENQALTLSVQGLPAGLSFAGTTISGTPTVSGNFPLLVTATDPGGLSANTTFMLVVTATGTAQPLALIVPLYNCQTGAITFRTEGGNGSLIEYRAVGVTDWSPNPSQTVDAPLRQDLSSSPVLTLMARQNGVVVMREFNFRTFCQDVPVNNLPPTFHGPLASQQGTQGQPFSYQIPQAAFSDPESGTLTFTVNGLPAGLSFNGATRTISGTPTQPGSYTVVITAADPQNATANGNLLISIAPGGTGPAPLQLVTPLYNCATGAITFQTTGGNGSLIEYRSVGVTDWSPNANQTVDAPLRQDLNSSSVLTLMARQNGVVVMLDFDFRAFCNRSTRIATRETAEQPLRVTLLGNPVQGESVEVDVTGAEGKKLTFTLTDMNGQTVTQQAIPSAAVVERQSLRIGRRVGGVLLLRVHTDSQQAVVKVIVP
ncbi:beta strand repeat-containing protein [Spirosoma utsteinense]|uniref:Uncharacterized protein n=1 Tax=Spirosoma utsteinense TaxID=2585773 RepID=A0ABR6WCG8_9BACT|nr:putative Ig domain-containing protein [Spirosoma utsteinense]MBC3788355.1 hypothetical protein [Spirosoma utsteinense]MBC3794272.1 hypothetical protein [Spirosoma utsteinense]